MMNTKSELISNNISLKKNRNGKKKIKKGKKTKKGTLQNKIEL